MREWIGLMLLCMAFSVSPLAAQTAELRPQISDDVANGVMIQLAAERSEALAAQSWIRIVAQSDDVLSGLTPVISPIRHGRKVRFYRLRAGPLPRDAAVSICTRLRARKLACDVVPRAAD